MELHLRGKSAAITGASKGIGLAIAEELAREGVDLTLAARTRDELQRAADDLRSRFQISVETEAVDLSKRDQRDAFAHRCAAADILVNNAGAIPGGTLDQVTEDAWREAWDLKLFGYIGIARIVYQAMCARRSGVIINVVGVGGLMTNAGYICGAPANAALINFTHALGGASVRLWRARLRRQSRPGRHHARELSAQDRGRESRTARSRRVASPLLPQYGVWAAGAD